MIILIILRWLFLHLSLGTSLIEEFLPKLPFWPTLMVTIMVSIYGYGHYNGHYACELAQKQAEIKQEKKIDKITKNVNNLSPSQLDKRLHQFYRD